MISSEQYYIDLLKPAFNFSQKAGWTRFGVLHTDESKKKMSLSCKGKNLGRAPVNKGVKLSETERLKIIMASKHRYKPVYFYDPETFELITMYESLNFTCRAEGASKTYLLNCIKTKKLFRGWLVSYTEVSKSNS